MQLKWAGAPIEAGTGRTDVKSQAYSMCFIVLRSKAVHVIFVTNNIGPQKSCGKTVYWRPNHWILNSHWRLVGIFSLVEADVVCNKSNVRTALLLRTVKLILYLGNILLRYLLIYNLVELSYNYRSTFLQVNVIKPFFFLVPAIFFELTITQTSYNSNFFRFFFTYFP